ncbi:MAG: GH92 family glycosyl hydrolase [bacterium]|nr:GH92 family glycosyl hydrolase [bacterium]
MTFQDNVDPFIGVDGAGNCLPGPYLPFGLVRLGPDTLSPDDPFSSATSGYRTAQPIVRFSHTHVSGTGGGGRYGNIGITPLIAGASFSGASYEREDESAHVGYYRVTLQPANIQAELTCTARVGVHRYHFPLGYEACLLVDIGTLIQTNTPGEEAYSTGGFLEVISDHELIGRGDFRGGWGHNFPYSVYCYIWSDRPIQQARLVSIFGEGSGQGVDGAGCKALLSFGEIDQLRLHVGVSYVSVAKARASVAREVGAHTFDEIRAKAGQVWEAALGQLEVEGGTHAQRTLFYTLLTRLLCMPSDLGIDDEFAFWHSGVRHFTDLYALWDSVRNANSLLTLLNPQIQVDILNFCIDVAEHVGWLPDAWIAGHSAKIQGGSSADILLCEAALKGLPGIDYARALHYMRKNHETTSPNPALYGRYFSPGEDTDYVSTAVSVAAVSRHLEYRYQDWCIGRLAEKLGQHDLANRYYHYADHVWTLWREDLKCFAPRHPDGEWVEPFDPAQQLQPQVWLDPYFYEGTSWQWSFSVHHDFAGLVQRHGGDEAFVRHLDTFFDHGYYFSKETMMHIPYLYHYAGRPDRTIQRVHALLESQFRPVRDGLTDNEDMGCQSAWYVWSSLGLYPMMGQDFYLLSAPIFKRMVFKFGQSEKTLLLKREGEGIHITGVTLNGEPLDRSWVLHDEIREGGTLCFLTGQQPSDWGHTHRPPSPLAQWRTTGS